MARETTQSISFNLARSIRFWTSQTLTQCGDKGGHFNVELYLRYLEVKRNQ